MRATIVVGLGFGDEGKGALVDALVRKDDATLVVRYNGGAQAAHNVVTKDGTHHTFAQFGAGTLAGAKTLLGRHVLVNPFNLFAEAKHLLTIGVRDTNDLLIVDRDARVTTPYHVAANRLRELQRGPQRVHGSCGLGIGETRHAEMMTGEALAVGDLADPATTKRKLERLRSYYQAELRNVQGSTDTIKREKGVIEDDFTLNYALDVYQHFASDVRIVDADWFTKQTEHDEVVFEGAQGVLLDEVYGFHPHTTWTDCTLKNAEAMLYARGDVEQHTIGVIRAYHTRHGAGPFPTEMPSSFKDVVDADHNKDGVWQREFRVGGLDLILLRYALDIVGPVGLFMNHIDQLGDTHLNVAVSYADAEPGLFARSTRIALDGAPDLDRQERLARVLENVRPRFAFLPMDDYAETVAEMLGRRLVGTGHGPTAENKRFV